jgi:hypothetical protein
MSSSILFFALIALASPLGVFGTPIPRQASVTSVDAATTDSFTPFSFYAATGYCPASDTLTWSCGANCDANPDFQPTTSGGDGVNTQFCMFSFISYI